CQLGNRSQRREISSAYIARACRITKHSMPVRRSILHCVCLIAAALPIACATVMPPPRHAEAPPSPPVSTQDAQAMVAMAQIAGRLEVPFADQVVEQM